MALILNKANASATAAGAGNTDEYVGTGDVVTFDKVVAGVTAVSGDIDFTLAKDEEGTAIVRNMTTLSEGVYHTFKEGLKSIKYTGTLAVDFAL